MHGSEDKEDDSDLGAEGLKDSGGINDCSFEFEVEADEPEVDEVEADLEEVIDAVRQFAVSVETIDEEDSSVFVEGASDPSGHEDADDEVDGVGEDGNVHSLVWLVVVLLSW